MHGLVKNEEPYKYKWINNFVSVVFVLNVNEIFLIENDIPYITENKSFIIIIVLNKGLKKSISHPRDEDL